MSVTHAPANFGVLYIATGQKYVSESVESAKSVRQIMPDVPIGIFSDANSHIPEQIFDHHITIANPNFSFIDKVALMAKSPFDNTLFLDSDTRLIAPIYELSNLLVKFDLACAHAPVRATYPSSVCSHEFPELNTGVILYKKSPTIINLFQSWLEIYQQQLNSDRPPRHDQPSFREALFQSSASFYVLPPEYNLRTVMPVFIGGNAKVRILHGREPSLSNLYSQLLQKPVELYPRVAMTGQK